MNNIFRPLFEAKLKFRRQYRNGELVELILDPSPSQPERHKAIFRPSNQKWEYKEAYAVAPFEHWLEDNYPNWTIVSAFPTTKEEELHLIVLKRLIA